ncbi:MAG TPA: glycosyl transferase, partial [Paracoccus sp. (in: a-proteobacteria)]|nr:glycosyl transferase [Paracoccus sp. (in: a-proteobacteria)]
ARHTARIYMDADIRPGPRMLGLLAQALDRPHPLYASGRLTVPPASSRISRHYARFWTRLPFVAEGVPGAGLFAVNGPGRARWDRFPAIISDDTYARLHFALAERIRVAENFTWPVVEGFPALVAVRRRQNAGVDEIRRLFPDLLANAQDRRLTRAETLRLAAADPRGFSAYAAVALAVRLRPQGRDWTRGR